MQHPSHHALLSLASGSVDSAETAEVADHIEHCDRCAAVVKQMSIGRDHSGQLQHIADSVDETLSQAFQIIHLDETNSRVSIDKTCSQVFQPVSRIIELCQQYEHEWTTSRRSDFPTLLEQVDKESRPMLLRNLLQIDLRRRVKAGERPVEQDYVTGRDEFQSIVREELRLILER